MAEARLFGPYPGQFRLNPDLPGCHLAKVFAKQINRLIPPDHSTGSYLQRSDELNFALIGHPENSRRTRRNRAEFGKKKSTLSVTSRIVDQHDGGLEVGQFGAVPQRQKSEEESQTRKTPSIIQG